MSAIDSRASVIDRLLRAFWAGAFPDAVPVVHVHEGRPGPTDPRASTLLVWSASPRPALLSVFDVSAGPATHGLDRAWHLAEALPAPWRAAVRIVPADGPTVRAWSERVRTGYTGQATHEDGRIRCTVTDEWIAGLPIIAPDPGSGVALGLPLPSATDTPALRSLGDGSVHGWIRAADGSCFAARLTPGPNGVRWTDPSWCLGSLTAAAWFDATVDPIDPDRLHVASRTSTDSGCMEWVQHRERYGLRWVPRTTPVEVAATEDIEAPTAPTAPPRAEPPARAMSVTRPHEVTTVSAGDATHSVRASDAVPTQPEEANLQTVQLDRRALLRQDPAADDDAPTQPLERPLGLTINEER